MRLFLAIDLPDKTKLQIEEQLDNLKKDYGSFYWIDSKNYHITIAFLGENIDKNNIENIQKKVEESIFEIEPFYLFSYSADLFLSRQIALYLEFRREKNLEDMVLKIKNSLHLEDDNKYIPHLTIARTRVPSKQQYLLLKKKLHHLPIEISFPVKKIFLFESILEDQKPFYKKISSFTLRQS